MYRRSVLVAIVLIVLSSGWALAQAHGSGHDTAQPQHTPAATQGQQQPSGTQKLEEHLSETSAAAAGTQQTGEKHGAEHAQEHGEDEGGHAAFLYSPMVRKLGGFLGLSPQAARWLFFVLNFLIIAAFFWWVARKMNLTGAFRSRSETIQKQLEEARHASADANQRLSEIEARLARLDTEIAGMREQTERDAAAEAERIRLSAEQDNQRIVEGAEHEIEAAAKAARRELKTFAADLAVSLAEKKIRIDGSTDEQLVRGFVEQLREGK